MYLHTQIMVMIQQRVQYDASHSLVHKMYEQYQSWASCISKEWKDRVTKGTTDPSWTIQKRVRLGQVTGIMDAFISCSSSKTSHLVEIKTCKHWKWKDDAYFQAFLYLMTQPSRRSTIHLLNPLRREWAIYRMQTPFPFYSLRTKIIRQLLLWNTNCILAKSFSIPHSVFSKPQGIYTKATYRFPFGTFSEIVVMDFFSECHVRFIDEYFHHPCVYPHFSPPFTINDEDTNNISWSIPTKTILGRWKEDMENEAVRSTLSTIISSFHRLSVNMDFTTLSESPTIFIKINEENVSSTFFQDWYFSQLAYVPLQEDEKQLPKIDFTDIGTLCCLYAIILVQKLIMS